MSDLLILRALLFAGECFLASLLLPLLAFAGTALLRRRAALRHLAWTTMFGVLAVLPVVALLLPPRRIVEHAAAPVMDAVPTVAAPVMAAPPPSFFTLENGVLLLVALWLAGLCWQAVRLGLGAFGLMRLRRGSAPFVTEIATGCAVRLSGGEHGPSTFGILRPLILLPRSAQDWPATRLDAVLRHEAAHVARRDAASQLLARLVCAAFWLNPLLWLAARQARRAAEIAADDAVLASGLTPSLYAAELVRLAAQARGPMPGIAMATPPLTQRVQSILETTTTRTGVSRMDIAKTVSFGLAATLLLGVARFDIAVAQDAPIMAPPAPAFNEDTASDMQRMMMQSHTQARAASGAAKAKAAAGIDRTKAEVDKARVAADTARVQALAARIGDPALPAADRIAATRALTEAAFAKLQARTDAVRQRAVRLAEAAPPSATTNNSASSSAEDSLTINGTTFSGNVHMESGKPGEPVRIDADRIAALPPNNQIRSMSQFNNGRDGYQIDIQISPGVEAEVNRPDVRDAIRDKVDAAMIEAGRKIAAVIAEARTKAGLPPLPPVAPVPPLPSPN